MAKIKPPKQPPQDPPSIPEPLEMRVCELRPFKRYGELYSQCVLTAIWLVLVLMLVVGSCRVSKGADLSPVDAVCKVCTDSGAGTGVVFEVSQGAAFVLTNAHVVASASSVTCEFWRAGHQSAPITGAVILRAADVDAAVIAISEAAFDGAVPAPIPVAPRNYLLVPGQAIASAGCANASWLTAWRGHVLRCADSAVYFRPAPADGRSGSPITTADGSMIVGLIRARTDANGGDGVAVPVERLYHALGRETALRLSAYSAQCGPAGCGPGTTPPPKYRVLPYRQKQEYRQQGNLWPTLPPPQVETPPPAPPSVAVEVQPEVAPEPAAPSGASPILIVLAAIGGLAVACLVYYSFPR